MAGKLEGRVALVTSAGQGIGRASAIALAREGAKVFATDIREELFMNISKEHPGITGFKLNVLEQAEVDAALKRTGPIDILFNCSGFVHNGTMLDCEDKDWDFSFDLNVKAHYRMIKAYLAGHAGKGQGQCHQHGIGCLFGEGCSQPLCLWRQQGRGNRPYQGPGDRFREQGHPLQLPSAPERWKRHRFTTGCGPRGTVEKAKAAFIARQPMGRMAQPEEIAEMVVYLASDDTAFITGQALVIDGGWSI